MILFQLIMTQAGRQAGMQAGIYIVISNLFHLPVNPFSPRDASKHHFTYLGTAFILLQLRGFRRKIYQYMAIFLNFSPTSSRLHPVHVGNFGSNSRLVVDEFDNGKVSLERFKKHNGVCGRKYDNL